MVRSIQLALVALPLLLAGCLNHAGDPSIEETRFHPSLNVDLSAMTRTPTGLYFRDLSDGDGAEATEGALVAIRYSVWLPDGTLAASNLQEPAPEAFILGEERAIIEGLHQGVRGMRVGGRRQLIVPPHLGYGNEWHPSIPQRSILVFRIDLVEVE